MKNKVLLAFLVCAMFSGFAFAQDVIVIDGGFQNAGLLEATINGDTTATGERANPDRIYELKAGQFYIQNAAINIDNPTGTLTIRGQEGGTKPVIVRAPVNEVEPGTNQINCSLTIQNVHWQAKSTSGQLNWQNFNIKGENRHLLVENSLFEFCNGIWFNLNNVPKGAEITVRNCYFRDLFTPNQWWASRAVQCKVPVDKFIFENNTVTGGGLTVLGQECLFEYSVIDHNTFINNHKYPFLNQYWKEVYFTNNLFVNANMVGEDLENVATGGQDPDALLMGICGVDTITNRIQIQEKFLNADSSLTDDVNELSDIIYYAADNIVMYSHELDNYYHGGYNTIADYPLSYLTWGGQEGPFQVRNVPGIWYNERSQALVDAWPNIVDENNHIYDMNLDDFGLATRPLDETSADLFAKWNRAQWGVPDAVAPEDMTPYYFGDNDPNTIPGKETEDGAGIEKFSDLIEDFSYTSDVRSNIDGKPIGSLMWWDGETYNADDEIAAIKAAYQAAAGGGALTGYIDTFDDGVLTGWTTDYATFGLSEADGVLTVNYNRTSSSGQWDQFYFDPPSPIDASAHPVIEVKVKSNVATKLTLKPIYESGDGWLPQDIPGDDAWHTYTFNLVNASTKLTRVYFYLDGGTTDLKSGVVQFDDFKIGSEVTAVEKRNATLPQKYDLAQNYPNPFNPSTTIEFSIPKKEHVKLIVFNQIGQQVASLADAEMSAGTYSVSWDAAEMPSGLYFYVFEAGSQKMTRKMMLVK